MRENGARVLVAALMTGAIAFALAMPAVLGTSAQDAVRSLTSPPSSLQRSVHVVASALPRPLRAGRLEPTHSITRAVPAETVPTFGRHPDSTGERTLVPKPAARPGPRPTPQPVPATDTRTLAGASPAAPVAQPTPSTAKSGHGKGKGKGRDKSKVRDRPAASESQPVPATPPSPSGESTKSDGEKDNDKDKGDHGKGHDK